MFSANTDKTTGVTAHETEKSDSTTKNFDKDDEKQETTKKDSKVDKSSSGKQVANNCGTLNCSFPNQLCCGESESAFCAQDSCGETSEAIKGIEYVKVKLF